MAAQQSVAARLATLGGAQAPMGPMVVAICCGKALGGCETQWATMRQMRALRSLIVAFMGCTKGSQAAGPLLLHSCGGQYEPELYRTRHVLRHGIAVAGTTPEYRERCDSPPKRRMPVHILKTPPSGAGAHAPSPLDWDIDGRR